MSERAIQTGKKQSILTIGSKRNPTLVILLGLAAYAWAVLAVMASRPGGLALCFAPEHTTSDRFLLAVRAEFSRLPLGEIAAEWILMVLAMMLPVITPHLAVFAARIYRAQRNTAVAAAVAGYMLTWILVGIAVCIALLASRALVAVTGMGMLSSLLAYVVAIGWIWLPIRRAAFFRCHASPLLYGAQSQWVRHSFRYGLGLGKNCSIVCLPLMAAPMISGQPFFVMFFVAHALLLERVSPKPNTDGAKTALSIVCLLLMAVSLAQ